jgi:hypothetical protein
VDDRDLKLLLKAVRSLPQRDQDRVIAALVNAGMTTWAPVGPRSVPCPPDVLFWSDPSQTFQARLPEPTGPTAMLPVRLPPVLHDRLRRWSNEHGFSMASVVRGLVERFLDGQDATSRERPPRARGGRSRPKPPSARG